MLTLFGKPAGHLCDRMARRHFIQVGGMALAGLSLADLLRAQAQAAPARRDKSVIMICLGGGPSQIDTYDMKPDAPGEFRGEFRPVATKVAGMQFCELMPQQAKIADKLAVVRTVQWVEPDHQRAEVFTGFPKRMRHPSFGSLVSRLYPGGNRLLPKFVSLSGDDQEVAFYEDPDFAGAEHRSFVPRGEGLENFALARGVDTARLRQRRTLLAQLDQFRRRADQQYFDGLDSFQEQALDLVTAGNVREAFDISKEPPELVARYGRKGVFYQYNKLNAYWDFPAFIRARRLVEAGVPFVSLQVGTWDHHGGASQGSIFGGYRTLLPLYDQAIAALITDLDERGLLERTAVLVWGEFGRTPRVNAGAGRDHWPQAGFALFAGGGLKTGQMVGRTDGQAEQPLTQPYSPQNVLATLYHVLGIDPATTIPDHNGRPRHLLEQREPIAELI